MSNSKLKTILNYSIIWLISGVLFYYVFKDINLSTFTKEIAGVHWQYIVMGFGFSFLALLLRALRWVMLIEGLQYKTTGFKAFLGVCIGYFTNYGLPRAGEVIRCATLHDLDDIPTPALIGTVVLERLLDVVMTFSFMALLLFLKFSLLQDFFMQLIQEKLPHANWPLLISMAVVGLGLFLLAMYYLIRYKERYPIIQTAYDLIQKFKEGLFSIKTVKNKPVFILYTVGIWLCYWFNTYLCFFSYEPTSTLNLTDGLFITIIGAFGMSAPVQGGVGAYHLLVGKAMQYCEVHLQPNQSIEELGVFFATLLHGTQLIFLVSLGVLSVLAFYYLKWKKTKSTL